MALNRALTLLPTLIYIGISISYAPQVYAANVNKSASYTTQTHTTEDDEWADDWEDDNWEEDTEDSPLVFSGFIEGAYGAFTQQHNLANTENKLASYSLNELRSRINLTYTHNSFDITAKGDLLIDGVTAQTHVHLREFNLSASPTDFLDIKIGKQILTWGTGDYIFLNDLFPKNWQSFFAGRDDEYLKAPSTSVKTSWFINNYTFDVVWTPEFTEDTFVRGERFSFYSPFIQQQIAPKHFAFQQTKSAQWFTRLSSTQQGIEYSLYAYKGRWPTPEGIQANQLPYFPKMNAVGASLRTSLGNGILNIEAVNYNSIENEILNTRFVPNSQQRLLIGYETELMKNTTLNTQYYVEHTKNYNTLIANIPHFRQVKDKNRHLLTTRLTLNRMQQKLIYSLFNFYSPSDHDGLLKASITYRQNDNWRYSLGANLFWGSKNITFFGQHQTNSNIWGKVRYQFN